MALAISLDGTDLRVLMVTKGRIERWTNVTVPPTVVSNGAINDGLELTRLLVEAAGPTAIKAGPIAASFPSSQALAQMVTLPPVGSANLDDAVRWEVHRHMLVDPDQYYIFHQPITADKVTQRVFVIAAKREVLDTWLATLRRASLSPIWLELRPLALVRAVGEPFAIIANMEKGNLDIITVLRGIPAVLRTIPLDENLSPDQAATLLADELDRTIAHHNQTYPDHPLNLRLPIWLTGHLATTPAATQEVQTRLGRSLARLVCPFASLPGFPVGNYMVAIGLLLKVL